MRKTILLLAIFTLTLASCSKQERTERKLVKAILSEDYETSSCAMNEFCEWIKADKSTMTHDFNYSREKLGMKVHTSSDGKVRAYSWITSQGDTITNYANVLQWLVGDAMVGYSGPLDAMLTGRQPNIKRQWSLAHSIDTIFDIQEATQPIYMSMRRANPLHTSRLLSTRAACSRCCRSSLMVLRRQATASISMMARSTRPNSSSMTTKPRNSMPM